ncbi:hypothetical protein ACH5RR_041264 [Cinchona calisaya]|uniref:Uncharacterized protein n=1 Tax=Cinchona calisaya TaxID=153742 RepID=A0ABD2XW63_9GENT
MSRPSCLLHFCLLLHILVVPGFSQSSEVNAKLLHVGKELWKETLPLQSGSGLYQLQGLKSNTWYEVKISYPASIPASFSIQLQRGSSDLGLNFGRKLLNTEKFIFRTDMLESLNDQGGFYVLVNVVPEGVVAIPGAQERKYIIFNIVCDELFLGIPYKAWYVVILVVLCLGIAFVIPSFLPPHLLPRNQNIHRSGQVVSKDS